MKTIALAPIGLTVLLALAGCVEETASNNPMFPNVGMSPDVSQAAVAACSRAVDAQTDGAVTVVGSEFSQAASAVYLVVGDQRAPWRCLASNDGTVSEIMFVGDEGAA